MSNDLRAQTCATVRRRRETFRPAKASSVTRRPRASHSESNSQAVTTALGQGTLAVTVARVRALWEVPSFRHFTLPALTGFVLLALFFSGNRTLASIVVPEVNRELGLLEHLQLLPLAGIALLAARVRAVESERPWRLVMVAAMAGAAFMLLEELNYGQHYIALLLGRGSEAEIGPLSLHNVSDTTDVMKIVGDTAVALLFVIVPIASRLTKRPLLGDYTPRMWYLVSVLLMVASGAVAVELSRAGMGPGWLRYNLSEFRELFFYYTGFLYAWDLSRVRMAKVAAVTEAGEVADAPHLGRRARSHDVAA
jgi:hypothetical protein